MSDMDEHFQGIWHRALNASSLSAFSLRAQAVLPDLLIFLTPRLSRQRTPDSSGETEIRPDRDPDQVFAEYTADTAAVLTAAALGSSCGEEACGLFGELCRKLEVRAVPGIRVEDQPGIR
jgi:hypothetical protein